MQIIQRAGEYVISLPGTFHMGYNLGSNVSESTNFITSNWPEYGKLYHNCTCKRLRFERLDLNIERFYDFNQSTNVKSFSEPLESYLRPPKRILGKPVQIIEIEDVTDIGNDGISLLAFADDDTINESDIYLQPSTSAAAQGSNDTSNIEEEIVLVKKRTKLSEGKQQRYSYEYKCKYARCKHIFSRTDQLKDHVLVAHDKKCWKCMECKIKYKSRRAYREHMKKEGNENHHIETVNY